MSSFWASAHQGDTDRLVELLSQGQDVDEYCPAGVSAYRPTALAYAVWGNQPDAVGLLLERGANPNRSDGDQNYYPLHWASYHRDHADCAQLLVEAGADLGVRTQKGYTPLQLAMGQNDLVSRKPGVIAVLEEAARNPFPPWVPPCRPAHASTRTPPPPARRATAAAPLTPPQQRPQPRPQVVTGRGLQLLGRWGGQGSIFAPEQQQPAAAAAARQPRGLRRASSRDRELGEREGRAEREPRAERAAAAAAREQAAAPHWGDGDDATAAPPREREVVEAPVAETAPEAGPAAPSLDGAGPSAAGAPPAADRAGQTTTAVPVAVAVAAAAALAAAWCAGGAEAAGAADPLFEGPPLEPAPRAVLTPSATAASAAAAAAALLACGAALWLRRAMRDEERAAPPTAGGAPPRPPTQFVCPITSEVMSDPVSTADGHTFERAAIERWLKTHDTSPMTGAPLPTKQLVPAISLRQLIADWRGEGADS